MLNKITVIRGSELIGEALRYVPRSVRKRNGNSVTFFDRHYMKVFYARLSKLRGDEPDRSKQKHFHFGGKL